MKKILFLSLLLLPITASSQNQRQAYCDLLATNLWGGRNVYIILDLGSDGYGSILNTDGSARKFSGVIDALNFMARLGWSVRNTYYLTEGKQKVLHYLLEKTITEDSQITYGINLKQRDRTPPKVRTTFKPGTTGDDLY